MLPACRRELPGPQPELPPPLLCLQEASRSARPRQLLSSTRASPTARRTTTSGGARCARPRSPSRAAASPPWPRSSTPSTWPGRLLPQAAQQGHLQGAERQALLSELLPQALLLGGPAPSLWPIPGPATSLLLGPRGLVPGRGPGRGGGEGANPTETGTASLAMAREGPEGSCLLLLAPASAWAAFLLPEAPPGCQPVTLPEAEVEGSHPRPPRAHLAKPAPPHWSHLLLVFWQ